MSKLTRHFLVLHDACAAMARLAPEGDWNVPRYYDAWVTDWRGWRKDYYPATDYARFLERVNVR